MKISVSEALTWQKTLKERHGELVNLRNTNAHRERMFYGQNADKERVVEPLYDVRSLDRLVVALAREMRLVDEAIKRSNAATELGGYDRDDAVLGELDSVSAPPAKEKV
jgi:hypothetical protein